MSGRSGLRILAVTADRRFLRQARVVLPLAALCRSGAAAGFRILCPTDRSLSDHFPLETFDAVLVQRCVPAWVTDFLHERGQPYLLDCDDLLLARPSYSRGLPDAAGRKALGRSLKQCAVLSIPHRRLVAALEQRLGAPLAHKAVFTPNAIPGSPGEPEKPASRPGAILYASSDRAALAGEEAAAVTGAVADLAKAQALPVYVMGEPGREILDALPMARRLGNMGYWRHKAFLRELPTALAVSPLAALGDAETLAFIGCKSDVKLAEYGGTGHAGVYSLSPAYAESDLRAGRLVENTRQAWSEALAWQLDDGYKLVREQAREIVARRHADRIAREAWLPALERVRLPRPLALSDLLQGARLPAATAGEAATPLHHQLADRIYHDWYCRFTPAFLRRRVGGFLEARLLGRRR